MIRRIRLRLRLARLHLEFWVVRRCWDGDLIAREDALEDIERDINDARYRLFQGGRRHDQ